MVEYHIADHLSTGENVGHRRRRKHEEELLTIAYLYGKLYMKEEEEL